MKRLSIEPRPPVNQGIDPNNPIVLRHTAIYNEVSYPPVTIRDPAVFIFDPYGTAPLSGYVKIWIGSLVDRVHIQITNDIGAIPVDYYIRPTKVNSNMIPLVGLIPNTVNHITASISASRTYTTDITTPPLPPTDAEVSGMTGFPIYEVTVPAKNTPETINELYFTAFTNRLNVGVDYTGTTRWYTVDLPSFNLERLSNGHFICGYGTLGDNPMLYEFDMVGRVHKVYNLDNKCHHSIYQLPDGNLLMPSEYTGTTVEDGLSIIDINTGLEIAYYDIRNVLDTSRAPVPIDPDRELDWLHINQSYLNVTNNLLISSGRHQGVFAIKADTSELVFILANHVDWAEEFQQYLLTPVDENCTPIYDFSNPDDIEKADKEFWNWGQHAVMDVPNSTEGIVEFILLDNGNFRSRDEAKALIPNDNYSRMVHYKVDLSNMTVMIICEYGKTEVGNRGYSSFVANQQALDNGNYMVNFGGGIFDENGRRRSIHPGYADIIDHLLGDMAQGMVLIQEIDPNTNEPQVEFTCTSGRYKSLENDGTQYYYDLFSFRSYKLPLIP